VARSSVAFSLAGRRNICGSACNLKIDIAKKNGFPATKLGQQIKFLLLQPKILPQQPNVLLIELNILLL